MIFHDKRNYKKQKKPIIISVLIIVILSVIIYILKADLFSIKKEDNHNLLELWDNNQYEEINNQCERILLKKPLETNVLIFNGFSYFYRSTTKYSIEREIPLLDKAIINLRKAKIKKLNGLSGKVNYILGKTYYKKGIFYIDLSIKYLEDSIKEGYIGEDTYEYLGLAYSKIEKNDKSIEYFLKAIEKKSSDTLFLVLAQTYYKMNNIEKAEEYLLWTLNRTKDLLLEEKSRFLLGKIYMGNEEYLKAEDQYKKILKINEKSADAYYYIGEIYSIMNETAKARFEWRKAIQIDANHYGARIKLSE